MSENERLRQIRDGLGLTLREFGQRVGISDSAVSQIEKGKIKMSDQTRLFVCKEFRVSEEWLRTGQGDMFITRTRAAEIGDFLGSVLADDEDSIRQRLIAALSKLDESDWIAIGKIIDKMKKDPEQ